MARNDRIDQIEHELDDRLAPEHPRRYADSDAPADDPATLRAEQHREAEEIVGGPGVPAMTGPMAKGMVGGGLLGALIGAVVMAPLALLPLMSESIAVRLVVVVAIGIAGGATAGAIYFGGRVPELSGESVDADNRPSAGSSLSDPNSDARGR